MKRLILTGLAASLTVAMACGGEKSSNPASPSPTGASVETAANADGSNLKVAAPTQTSPGNGATLDTFSPALTIQKANALYVEGAVFAYRFQLLNGSTVLKEVRQQGLTWVVDGLENKTTYGWRARAEQGSYFGPWSATWTFTTPDKPQGFNRPGELYDPLNNGETIGSVIGNVTFTDQGARLNNLTSYIRYQLAETLVSGEISALITGIETNTEGDKTKIMSMIEGFDDNSITVNDRRFTIEKRGNPAGIIAWRVITSNDQIDTVGSERVKREFNPSRTYLWRATWGSGRFNLQIKEDGVNGREIYSFGKGYAGVYDPRPHMAFVGGPGGRAGADSGSVPGIVVRHFWVSNKPRPSYANQ
jgi:hypothetical protein